jgi:hypothetical protein
MRIIVRLAVVLAVIAALVYGGLWGYSWYKVKTAMDRAVEQSAPYAEIKYSSIYASPRLDGTVGVDGIVIKPKMTDDVFKIQSIRLSLPGIFPLITAKKDDFPESMRLSVSGIRIDLNSPLLVSLSAMQKQAIKAQGKQSRFPMVSWETLGCGSVESIGIDELSRMGYRTMEFDIDLEYRYAKIKNLLNISSVVRMEGMQSVDIKSEMRIPPSELAKGNFSNLVIDSIRIDLIDAGYAALRNRFCAAQLESTEDAYFGKNIELLSRELGTTFPLETIEAYKKVMQGSRMSLVIAPKPGIELAMLNRYAAKDVIDILGVKLILDTHEVDFNKFDWGKNYSAVNSDESKEGEAANSASSTPLPIAKPAHVPASYHATSPAKLGRYVGYKVRLTTRTGQDRDGIITGAEAGSITLRQTASAGKGFISFQIATGDISTAEVLY